MNMGGPGYFDLEEGSRRLNTLATLSLLYTLKYTHLRGSPRLGDFQVENCAPKLMQ
jgi:hypothetical protein